MAESREIFAESTVVWLSDKDQVENSKVTDFLRDFCDRECFYLTFCEKKGKKCS